MQLRVMTWNIWSGKNWQQIAQFAKDNHVDIMGFQEVDNNLERTGHVDIAESIANQIGFHFAYSASIENSVKEGFQGGQFGNCIISKYPIVESSRHFLSLPETWDGTAVTEPRTVLETRIDLGKKVICFMTLHLGYSRNFVTNEIKLKQVDKVIEVIRKNREYPLVLVGDFNSLPENQEIQTIKNYLIDVDEGNSLRTWTNYDFEYHGWRVPAGLTYKVDFIFVSKNLKFGLPRISENNFSDHVPVIVDIEL